MGAQQRAARFLLSFRNHWNVWNWWNVWNEFVARPGSSGSNRSKRSSRFGSSHEVSSFDQRQRDTAGAE
jgi:hypothetical protein